MSKHFAKCGIRSFADLVSKAKCESKYSICNWLKDTIGAKDKLITNIVQHLQFMSTTRKLTRQHITKSRLNNVKNITTSRSKTLERILTKSISKSSKGIEFPERKDNKMNIYQTRSRTRISKLNELVNDSQIQSNITNEHIIHLDTSLESLPSSIHRSLYKSDAHGVEDNLIINDLQICTEETNVLPICDSTCDSENKPIEVSKDEINIIEKRDKKVTIAKNQDPLLKNNRYPLRSINTSIAKLKFPKQDTKIVKNSHILPKNKYARKPKVNQSKSISLKVSKSNVVKDNSQSLSNYDEKVKPRKKTIRKTKSSIVLNNKVKSNYKLSKSKSTSNLKNGSKLNRIPRKYVKSSTLRNQKSTTIKNAKKTITKKKKNSISSKVILNRTKKSTGRNKSNQQVENIYVIEEILPSEEIKLSIE